MILQPRKFKFKSIQKNRSLKTPKIQPKLYLGNCGLVLNRSLILKSKQMSKFKIFLKRATKKVDKTQRFSYINFFPHLPLTRKPKQSRMGKGKGKRKTWYIHLKPGNTILEFKNLRFGRACFFFNAFSRKLNVPTYIIYSTSIFVKSPLLFNNVIRLKTFW